MVSDPLLPQIRGGVLSSRMLWVSLHHGEAGTRAVLEALGPEARAILSGPVAKERWYPFVVFTSLNEVIDRLYGTGDLSLVRALGRFSADANMTTIYRLFYRVGTVSWILERGARLWGLHYDAGRLCLERKTSRSAVMRIADFPTPHRSHCLSVAGWAERSVELSGGRDVEMIEVACRAQGASSCSFLCSWR